VSSSSSQGAWVVETDMVISFLVAYQFRRLMRVSSLSSSANA